MLTAVRPFHSRSQTHTSISINKSSRLFDPYLTCSARLVQRLEWQKNQDSQKENQGKIDYRCHRRNDGDLSASWR
jgi:hypothetical protein